MWLRPICTCRKPGQTAGHWAAIPQVKATRTFQGYSKSQEDAEQLQLTTMDFTFFGFVWGLLWGLPWPVIFGHLNCLVLDVDPQPTRFSRLFHPKIRARCRTLAAEHGKSVVQTMVIWCYLGCALMFLLNQLRDTCKWQFVQTSEMHYRSSIYLDKSFFIVTLRYLKIQKSLSPMDDQSSLS
jgi:hypothetical protein